MHRRDFRLTITGMTTASVKSMHHYCWRLGSDVAGNADNAGDLIKNSQPQSHRDCAPKSGLCNRALIFFESAEQQRPGFRLLRSLHPGLEWKRTKLQGDWVRLLPTYVIRPSLQLLFVREMLQVSASLGGRFSQLGHASSVKPHLLFDIQTISR
jgi:hypothetical protein